MPAQVAILSPGPAPDEFLEFGIAFLRQNDLHDRVLIAPGSVGPQDALSFQAKTHARVDPAGDLHPYPARQGRNVDCRAKDRLAQRDGDFHFDVVTLADEEGMRSYGNRDERVARRAAADSRSAFAAQAQHLPVTRAGRYGDIEDGPVGKAYALGRTVRRFQEVQCQTVMNVTAPHAELGASIPTAEKFGQDIFKIGKPGRRTVLMLLRIGRLEVAIIAGARPLLSR